MTFGDICRADAEEIAIRKEERENEVSDFLFNILSNSDYEVSNIQIDFKAHEESGRVNFHFKLPDGFEQDDDICWKWEESIEDICGFIKKHIDYIEELRNKYPDYARINDHIQKFRKYEKTFELMDRGYSREGIISAELCGYLKLPNTTSCSFGGGDYELKKTPQRAKDFNDNIDSLCLFLADCISELRGMKLKEKEDTENANPAN